MTLIKSLDNLFHNIPIKENNTIKEVIKYSNNKYNLYFDNSNINLTKKKYIFINEKIDTLNDLLNLIKKYPIQHGYKYNINLQSLHNIYPYLVELNDMIGNDDLKNNITEQILYFIQELHSSENDYMHTCIYGPPGTGKTEISRILGNIYSKLGILKNNIFKKASRSELIAGYLGQTSIKTKTLIKSCLGGVLFIDEAYSLGNKEQRDMFSKECIDTLCECLSEYKNELMVIIAGYEKELDECFFSYNNGLKSRFSWTFKTDDYTSKDLKNIFIKKINDSKWKFNKNDIKDIWFERNKEYFKYYGRDMETLFSKVKIAHSKRVFCLDDKYKKIINMQDLEEGFKKFKSNLKENNNNEIIFGMYT
jgi:replication-associated recombination protein RarA